MDSTGWERRLTETANCDNIQGNASENLGWITGLEGVTFGVCPHEHLHPHLSFPCLPSVALQGSWSRQLQCLSVWWIEWLTMFCDLFQSNTKHLQRIIPSPMSLLRKNFHHSRVKRKSHQVASSSNYISFYTTHRINKFLHYTSHVVN